MSLNKKILFYSYGDANKASTWSNVPFFFSTNLEKMGYEIIRVDINPSPKLNNFWNRYIYRYINILYPNSQYPYLRTYINHFLTYRKIKKSIRNHSSAYFCIFTNFDFYNKFSGTPSLLFGDWTYDIVIKDRINRNPYFFEKWFSIYQKNAIENAKAVVSLFEDCAEKMKLSYKNKNICHLGINVVNDLNYNKLSNDAILEKKRVSNSIIFIGGIKYLEGAKKLVESYKILKNNFKELTLHLVGITQQDLGEEFEGVFCYGYLNKDNSADNKTYYDLLQDAKVIVNPTDVWAGYSSIVEAMYYYTPIIIPRYESFARDFGENIDFGYYLKDTNTNTLVQTIDALLTNKDYLQLCVNANFLVKDYTWESFTKKIASLMEKVDKGEH
jgi:glycosyltransferase involved in cell wall biosynthesis